MIAHTSPMRPYAFLHSILQQQDRDRDRMRPELQRVFDHLADYECAIVGSSLREYDTANDIDVLCLAGQDFRTLAKALGVTYLGAFPSAITSGKVRRLSSLAIEGVDKPLQVISDSSVATFDQWPHAVLLRDGRRLNAGKHYVKPNTNSKGG